MPTEQWSARLALLPEYLREMAECFPENERGEEMLKQLEKLYQQQIVGARTGIVARNLSHGLGPHARHSMSG